MSNDKSILRQSKIGIIGAGNMGRALAMGLLKSKVVTKSDLVASDVDVDAAQAFEKVVGVRTVQSNAEVVGFATVLVLAVKPQVMDGVLEDLAKTVKPQQLVMSIAAGISLARLEKFLTQSPLVRIMPNTPALVGMGISAVCANALANPTHRAIACAIMEAVGDVIAVDETSMDAVTATSGSGPAYVFYFMEALMEGAMRQGLDAKLARLLVLKTVEGSVRLAKEAGESLETLRKRVTSPGGTTEAALRILEGRQTRDSFIAAIAAATKRGKELSDS